MTDFTVFCLLGSLTFNIIGIYHKYFLPKNYKWWFGIKSPSALRNEDTWREANTFIVFPSFIAGALFIIIAFLPEFFPDVRLLSFRTAGFLIFIASIALVFITDRHLKRIFDEDGNRKY